MVRVERFPQSEDDPQPLVLRVEVSVEDVGLELVAAGELGHPELVPEPAPLPVILVDVQMGGGGPGGGH